MGTLYSQPKSLPTWRHVSPCQFFSPNCLPYGCLAGYCMNRKIPANMHAWSTSASSTAAHRIKWMYWVCCIDIFVLSWVYNNNKGNYQRNFYFICHTDAGCQQGFCVSLLRLYLTSKFKWGCLSVGRLHNINHISSLTLKSAMLKLRVEDVWNSVSKMCLRQHYWSVAFPPYLIISASSSLWNLKCCKYVVCGIWNLSRQKKIRLKLIIYSCLCIGVWHFTIYLPEHYVSISSLSLLFTKWIILTSPSNLFP